MRLIDADWVLAHIKSYELSDEDWIVTGGTAIRLIRHADENVPYCSNRFGLNDPEPNGFCNYKKEKNVD